MRWRSGARAPETLGRDLSAVAKFSDLAQPFGFPAVLEEPLGGVLGVDAEFARQHLGRGGRGGQAEHRTRAVLGLPRRTQPGHRGGLARSGRPDQDVESAPRRGDLLDCQGLVERTRRGPGAAGWPR